MGLAKLVGSVVSDGALPSWSVMLGALASLLCGFWLLVLVVLDDGAQALFTALLVLVVLTPFAVMATVSRVRAVARNLDEVAFCGRIPGRCGTSPR